MNEKLNHIANIEQSQQTLKHKSVDEMEELVMVMMSAGNLEVQKLCGLVSSIAERGEVQRAMVLGDLLREELVRRRDMNGLIEALISETKWRTDDEQFRKTCKNSLITVSGNNTLARDFVESAGFDGNLPPVECLRRLITLMLLKPGACCIDNTWGFGIVQKIDELRRKIIIDFDNRHGHEMSFGYAGESLQILERNHLRTMLHFEPDKVRELGLREQAELVKLALSSCGPLTKAHLKELFVGKIFSEEEWQIFWDKARASLKKDPFVEFPSRSTEPLRLLTKPVNHSEVIASELDKKIATSELLGVIHKILSMPTTERESALEQKAVNKFLDVLRGLKIQDQPELIARALILSKRISAYTAGKIQQETTYAEADTKSLHDLAHSLLQPERLISALNGTPSRETTILLEVLIEYTRIHITEHVIFALPELKPSIFDEVIEFLLRSGEKERCVEAFRKWIATKPLPPVVVLWMCRNHDSALARDALQGGNVLDVVLDILEDKLAGENLKIYKTIKKLLENSSFVERVLAVTDDEKCSQIFRKIMNLRGVEDITKRTIMGLMIKLKPALSSSVQTDTVSGPASIPMRVTSWRSYRKRYAQYRELIEVQIPKNSRDIDAARSYGDLSENFEYHAALEQQKLLLCRRDELMRDLHAVKGTDFRDILTDKVRHGTTVVIVNSSGAVRRITILGEWDSDEELGIVSSGSSIAKALIGHKTEDEVMIASDTGDEVWRIIEILPLSQEIRTWIESD